MTEAIRLNSAKAKYYFRRAAYHVIKSNWAEAIADYTEALRLKPDPLDEDAFNFTVAEVYRERGIAYRYLGDYEASLADFTELTQLEPDYPYHYEQRSITYKFKGDFENALQDLYTVQQLKPNQPIILLDIVDVRLRQGNKEAAKQLLDEVIERFKTPLAYYMRSQLLKEESNVTEAIADQEEAIKQYPRFHPVYVTLGETYLAHGNFAKAVEVLNALMDGDPGYRYGALYLRARAYLALGDFEQANRDFAESITVIASTLAEFPNFTQGYVTRGHVHAAQGNVAQAVADYTKALELEPNHPESGVMREYVSNNT